MEPPAAAAAAAQMWGARPETTTAGWSSWALAGDGLGPGRRLLGGLTEEQEGGFTSNMGEPDGRSSRLNWACQAMEGDGSDSLIPFIKQSKMVSRYQTDVSSSELSIGNFWDRHRQQPSSLWMEEYHKAHPLLTSSCVVQRPAEAEVDPFPWQVISAVQKLPSPKELCQRKKRGSKRKRLKNVRALSVCYHLEELKRRQSSIDELKKATWGGFVPQPFYEAEEGAAADPLAKAACREDPLGPSCMPQPADLHGKDPALSQHRSTRFLYPEWNPSTKEPEQLMIPTLESPVISYTMATQARYQVAKGCLSEEDFWGFRLPSEE
ncbi:protein INCA1 [Hemicordylus capensis]|uniref:protein INCA1 n=1 Tax=Hemicordylus capensis TaxID=884348 RepID=UPI002303DDA6|nr:protein INCA1 [Hemicordylus capensis]